MTGIPHGPGSGDAAADGHELGDAQSLAAAINEEVSLHPPDLAWFTAFELERTRLQALLPGVFVQVEHIGSTAVPGLAAKPVVDIMAGVESLTDVDATIATLCQNGYTTSKEFNALLTDRKWLMRWKDGHRTHHLHIVVFGGAPWDNRLAFRDALRRDPDLVRHYAALKIALVTQHPGDREAYTDAKADFVLAVIGTHRQP
jgi:GrpB-like predicted nucleotidyltransferase (UPF0157 family)